jgi:pimeloyl-ACP methyl ester carboxylesterase
MAERLPSGRLEVVPGAGHNVVLETPDSVTAVLRAQVESIR